MINNSIYKYFKYKYFKIQQIYAFGNLSVLLDIGACVKVHLAIEDNKFWNWEMRY